MKEFIKKFIPKALLLFYHRYLAILAGFFYRYPSNKLMVIGVTGTSGKSTTIMITAKILEEAGFKVGYTTTHSIKIADQEFVNKAKMTMFGRFRLQKILNQMVKAGCRYAIIEVTSEGILQYRHYGINFDIGVLTNLSPEHIESHGSYENYKRTKGALFKSLSSKRQKILDNKKIEKISIVNLDDQEAEFFSGFEVFKKYGFTLKNSEQKASEQKVIKAESIKISAQGLSFKVGNSYFSTKLLGQFNLANILCAVTLSLSLGVDLEKCKRAIERFPGVPGRMEVLVKEPFTVIVDFAFLPQAFEKIYQTLESIPHKRIIHVFGGTGGGRDKARRPVLGKFAAEHAEFVIVTNEDPYDEDPMQIINEVSQGVVDSEKKEEGKNFWKILDRREAIKKALSIAKKGDLVLITGKGSEPVMVVRGGKKIPWDDRKVVKELMGEKQ